MQEETSMPFLTRWFLLLVAVASVGFSGWLLWSERTGRLGAQRERIVLKETIAQKDQRISNLEAVNKELEDLNKDYRDKVIEAQLRAEQQYEKNADLWRKLDKSSKRMEKRAPDTPPEDHAQGEVVNAEKGTGLVIISIGSNEGVTRGQTLEVYRLKPKPEYVGMIRVLDTRFAESVARAINPLRAGPIQKGDIVAPRILTAMKR
jgi:hypothetical protein